MKKITEGFESQIIPVLDSGGRPTGRYMDSSAPEMEIINLPRDKHYLQIDFPCGFWIVDNYGDRVYHSANSWVIDVFKLLPVKWQENKPKFQIFLEYNPEELAGRDYRINTTNLDISAVSGVNGQVVTISEESGAMVAILEQLREINRKISAECGVQIVYPLDKTPLEATKEKYVNKVGSATLLDGRRVDGALVTDVVTEGGETFFIVQYEEREGGEKWQNVIINCNPEEQPFWDFETGKPFIDVPETDVFYPYRNMTLKEMYEAGYLVPDEDLEQYKRNGLAHLLEPPKIKVAKAYAYGDSFAVDRTATAEKAAELAQVAAEEEARFKEEQERIAREKEEEEKKKKEEEAAAKSAQRTYTGQNVFVAYREGGRAGRILGNSGDAGRATSYPYGSGYGGNDEYYCALWRLYVNGFGEYFAGGDRVVNSGQAAANGIPVYVYG